MTRFQDAAPAKINLSLRVLGRRQDGYHELDSLVAFATVGDRLTLTPGPEFALTTSGAFGGAIGGENLIARANRQVAVAAGNCRLTTGTFHLEKNLPVAAGLGGGSADAAAALRLLRRANPDLAARIDWPRIAASLGADVPVCLEVRAAVMRGIGEIVSPAPSLPPVAIVLANPRVGLATADVFRALAAPALAAGATPQGPPLAEFREFADLLAFLAGTGNDLEPVARRLCPSIGPMLARLTALPGARLARMSGSGPTCFALFERIEAAEFAAHALAASEPGWWVAAARLA